MMNLLKGKKTKRGLLIFGTGVLSFIILIALASIAIAIINVFLNGYNFNAYTISFIALTALALIVTFIVILVLYIMAQRSQKLIDGLNRVAAGDYTARIDYSRRDALGELYNNFNKMTHELNNAKNVRDEFVHTLSHEIKTPLFSIQGFANLLLEGGLSEEEQTKFLKIIADEAGRLTRLTENAMLLTKVESQEFAGERKLIKLDSQINDCIILLERSWSEKNIEVSSEAEPVKIYGDGELLKQLWLNLLSNAVKFSPEGGKIEISVKAENGRAVVSVKDNGCGISPEDIPKIFQKNYRSERANKVEGSGLGLAICKRICEISGGDISAESEPEKGSVFTVTLPLGEA